VVGTLATDVAGKLRARAARRTVGFLTELEIGWIADTLSRFDAAWDALNDENRSRLVRFLVERVEVDEPSGQVSAALVDLGLADEANDEDVAAPASATTMEASP
jgi:hypothetical protein